MRDPVPLSRSLRLRVLLPPVALLGLLLGAVALLGARFLDEVAQEIGLARVQELRASLRSLLILSGLAVAAYAAAMVYLFGGLGRRMEQIAHGMRRLRAGDFQVRVGARADADELSEIGRALDAAAERLARLFEKLGGHAAALDRTTRDFGDAAAAQRNEVAAQLREIEDALQAARGLVQALSAQLKQAESLREEARLCTSVASRLAALGQEGATVAEEADRLVVTTSEGLHQMAGVISDVTRRGRLLAESASAASGALAEVKHTIGRVLETAQGAAALAEQAGMDTERGSLVLSESLDGIEHIRQASRAIGAVTDDLQRRVAEIGDILHLIAELTQRTNLLALNASIIAAQAGVEGRGFAVVADEIKDLARRTAESAGSIDSLIQALAEGAHAARRAAMAGGEAVEAGAARARDAARAMSDILTRLRSWTVMARSIATATEEQARAAAQATRAVQEVQGMAAEIVGRAVDQSRRTEHVQRQAARLQELTAMLLQSAQEERDGAAQAADTLARLLRTIEELGGAGRGRVGESERLAGLLQHVRRVALGQRDAAATLLRTATALRAQAEALAEELAPLKK